MSGLPIAPGSLVLTVVEGSRAATARREASSAPPTDSWNGYRRARDLHPPEYVVFLPGGVFQHFDKWQGADVQRHAVDRVPAITIVALVGGWALRLGGGAGGPEPGGGGLGLAGGDHPA